MRALLLALTCLISTDSLTGKVVKIADGDTITILVENRQVKIRLSEIDAPEHGQDFGQKNKEALADLVFEKEVRVVTHGEDRYGRTIGDVFVGQTTYESGCRSPHERASADVLHLTYIVVYDLAHLHRPNYSPALLERGR
jgi:hypothetical protein